MKKFMEFLEHDVMDTPDDLREYLKRAINRLVTMRLSDLADSKDALLELQKVLNDKLAGM